MGVMLHRSLLAALAIIVVGCSSETSSTSESDSSTTNVTLLTTTTSSTTTTPPTTTTTSTTTTSTSTTTTSTTTTTTSPAPTTTIDPAIGELVLSMDGIGSASFGAEPDGVVEYVSSFLGAPTKDSGWVDPLTIGPCPGEQLRMVRWGSLVLEFSDVSNVAENQLHFYAYSYGLDGEIGVPPVGLVTTEGITIASKVSELVQAYPDVILNPEDDFIASNFYVNDDLRGLLTGLADDDLVTVVAGGRSCAG